ncbi:MAG: EipB family protein [Parvibaculaceae bacterium]
MQDNMMYSAGRTFASMTGVALALAAITAASVLVVCTVMPVLRMVEAQAHRAVYDLNLDHASGDGGVTGLQGRMVVEWRGGPACDGYTSEQRVVTKSTDDQGHVSVSDVRLSAWESVDGNEFRFDRTEYADGTLSAQVFGKAHRANGKVMLKLDHADPIQLPSSVLFPTAFNAELTKAINRGRSSYVHLLFDGAQAYATNVTAFIGKDERPAGADGRVQIKNAPKGVTLAQMKERSLHVSYFDLDPDVPEDTADTSPSFEMDQTVFPNGVMGSLKLLYQDASINGVLQDVEYFKPGSC